MYQSQIPTAANTFWKPKKNHQLVQLVCHFCQHTDFIWQPENKQPSFQYCYDCRGTCAECGNEVLHPRDQKSIEFCRTECQDQWKQIQICVDSIEKRLDNNNNEECCRPNCELIHEKIWIRLKTT